MDRNANNSEVPREPLVQNHLRELQSKYLVIFSTTILLIGVLLSLYVANQQQNPRSQASTAAGSVTTLHPIADSYVASDTPVRNFGLQDVLQSKTSPTKIIYMKFDGNRLAGATINSAKLRLKVRNASSGIQRLRFVRNNNWNERTITFQNRPTIDDRVLATIQGGRESTWVEFDLTSIVRTYSLPPGSVYSLAITTDSTNQMAFYSNNSTQKPELVVTYSSTVTPAPSITPTATPTPIALSCSAQGGTMCANNSTQACSDNQWAHAGDTNFCCKTQCVPNPICTINPVTGKQDVCACQINPNKDKFTVVIKKGGELDTASVLMAIDSYMLKASTRTKKLSVGIKKFEGSTSQEFTTFIHNLYKNEHVGSIIIVGKDLPIFTSDGVVTHLSPEVGALSYVDQTPTALTCRTIAISFVIPRLVTSSGYSPVQFVQDTFTRFAEYHADTGSIRSAFKKEALHLHWNNSLEPICGENLSALKPQSILPSVELYNTQHQTLKSRLTEKFAFQSHNVHGSEYTQGLGLTNFPDGDLSCSSVYTRIPDIDESIRQTPGQFLLVYSFACQNATIGNTYYSDCCFPQKYLEWGSWMYYNFGGGFSEIERANNMVLNGGTFADAARQYRVQTYLFGDILAGL